nr:immunoglobulin heavy chain junction region [Macaca mulatta]
CARAQPLRLFDDW